MTYKIGTNVKGWLGREEAYDFQEHAHGEYLRSYGHAGDRERLEVPRTFLEAIARCKEFRSVLREMIGSLLEKENTY